MGRAFEYRKARKMKRWGHMARVFTKLGKEIEIAVKAAGPDPSANTRLRLLIQNAKAENMPKENVERAIKRATEKDAADYKEVVYEGYGAHGIAFLVETATDNTNRTVANVRMHFNKCGGTLGNSGSVAFMFEHKCVFKFRAEGVDPEELELESIADAIGDILDSLVASPTYGKEKTSLLFIAILQSEMVRDSASLNIATATRLARRGSEGETVNYKETFKTLTKTVAVMDSMNKNSGKLDTAEITQLIETINPQSAGMIEEYVTPERMEEDYQMEKEQSVVAAPLISNTFGYLASNEVEDYEKEAAAINHVMSITMAARDSANDPEHNKSLLGSDGILADQGDTEEERAANVVDAFMASDAVAHSLATTPYEDDPFALSSVMENNEDSDEMQTMKDAMADYYHTPGNNTEENKEKLTNMANLFGIPHIEEVFE